MKRYALVCWMVLLSVVCSLAVAQTAREITNECELRAVNRKALSDLTDRKYKTYWVSLGGENAYFEGYAPQDGNIGSVYIQFYEYPMDFIVMTQGTDGEWTEAARSENGYYAGYVALAESAQAVRIIPEKPGDRLSIAEAYFFSEGDAPDWVQQWKNPLQKADLLVMSTHPDDELLFLGGTIPYYAGERGLDVQVSYLVPASPYRRLELLDGLWLCGVRYYPVLGNYPDYYELSLSEQYAKRGWAKEGIERFVASLYRRFQPEVVVTQDLNGEYGHGAHRALAAAALACAELAADENFEDRDNRAAWQIQKLYLHLYPEGALEMDWRQPLEAFGGKTAFDIAEAAFQCHKSQLKGVYSVQDDGPTSCARFGLAYSTVGEDEEKTDFFEHIEAKDGK